MRYFNVKGILKQAAKLADFGFRTADFGFNFHNQVIKVEMKVSRLKERGGFWIWKKDRPLNIGSDFYHVLPYGGVAPTSRTC